jgi:hypothetical protein
MVLLKRNLEGFRVHAYVAAAAPAIEIGHGERSSATTRLEVRFNPVPIGSPERLIHTVHVFKHGLHCNSIPLPIPVFIRAVPTPSSTNQNSRRTPD